MDGNRASLFAGALHVQYKGTTTYFLHRDHWGSTRLVTALDQSVSDNLDYLPFGEQIAGDTGTTHKFTGKERDAETGLDYFGARYDSGVQGRFTSPDKPFADQHAEDPQSWNLYSYSSMTTKHKEHKESGAVRAVRPVHSVTINHSATICFTRGGRPGVR